MTPFESETLDEVVRLIKEAIEDKPEPIQEPIEVKPCS